MIRKVIVKNYKSLVNFTANFGKSTDSGNIAIIYGGNGSGKTNFLSLIQAVSIQTTSLYNRTAIMEIANDRENRSFKLDELDELIEFFKRIGSIESLFSEAITIDEEIGSIEIEFDINGRIAEYSLKFNREGLVKERLYYILNENRGELYNIELNENGKIEKSISPQFSYNKDLSNEINSEISQFWGKYSLLSIIHNIIETRNINFWEGHINKNVIDVLKYFNNFFILNLPGEGSTIVRQPRLIEHENFVDLEKGTLPDSKESKDILSKAEEILYNFLSPLYKDIVNIKYETSTEAEKINYWLVITKEIANEIREVPVKWESSGTKNIIKLLPYILEYIRGGIVLIDEIENAIHDLLIKDLIESLINIEDVQGQLIATTHNTMIMEQIDDGKIYVLADMNESKSLNQISSYSNKRIRASHNVRTRYLDGLYFGIPFTREIDFYSIMESTDEHE